MPDQVVFNQIPSNTLVPFGWFEINSGGSPFEGFPRLLLLGQKLAGGSAPAGAAIGPIQNEADAVAFFGNGSMLQYMFRIARRNAPGQPIWALPLADPAGAAAAGSVTFTTAPGVTGPGVVRVMGREIVFQVNAADANTVLATNFVAALNAAGLPVTAAVDGTTAFKANITARHVGAAGNTIDVAIIPGDGNVLTATNTTLVAMAAGSGNPALTTPLANLGDDQYDWIAGPYVDATSLNSIRDFLDNQQGRWSPTKQLYGHYITANFGNLSANVTLGTGRNDPHVSIMGSQASPSPAWEWAAALGGIAVLHLANPPELSRPLQTLALNGILPPDDRSKWWATADRQALYTDGIAAYKVDTDGTVRIDRVVTTYQHTAALAPDATFRDIETMAQAMYAVRFINVGVTNRHSRQALADDNPYNLTSVTTPRDLRNTVIHLYEDLIALGVAENADVFAANVIVERNSLDPNRVNAFIPIDVVNQLRVFAGNVTMLLQFASPSGAVAI